MCWSSNTDNNRVILGSNQTYLMLDVPNERGDGLTVNDLRDFSFKIFIKP